MKPRVWKDRKRGLWATSYGPQKRIHRLLPPMEERPQLGHQIRQPLHPGANMLATAPDKWGGWYWAHCPHPTCYWVHRAETLLNAQAALSHHQAEAHRD